MTVVSVIASPSTAPQVQGASPPGFVTGRFFDPAEERIRQAVRTCEPVHIWKLLNRLVEAESPSSRDEARSRKLELWQSVNRLLRCQMLFRAGRHGVTTIKPSPPAPHFKQPGRKREKTSTVVHCVGDSAGSTAIGTPSRAGDISLEEPQNQMTSVQCGTGDGVVKTESAAPPNQEERSNAARALAKLRWNRRPRKKWSGWLPDGTRVWRGRRVVVDGQVWFAYGCLRNKLVISMDDGKLLGWPGDDDLRWRVVPAHTATVWRDPHAQALGGLKRGKKERLSDLKGESARRNGASQSRKMSCDRPSIPTK